MQINGLKRNNIEKILMQILIPVFSVLLALAISAIIIVALKINPVLAFKSLIFGALGTPNSIAETLVKTTPLLFTGLSFALANRCGLINIGAEGQLYMGGLLATIVGVYVTGLPSVIHLPLALAVGMLGGGLWGLLAGILKVKFGASEIITTVMLNFIAINFSQFMVNGPITEPPGTLSQSMPIKATAKLPNILPGTRIHLGIFIALLFVVLYYIFLWRTKQGYEVRVAGFNVKAAKYSGINTSKNILLVMFLAGGMAGLAGANEILGIQGRLLRSISPGYGFDGIAVALIGLNHPAGIVIGAILFGMLRSGGNMMQMMAGVPVSIIYIIQAIVIISVVASQMFSSNKPKINKISKKGLLTDRKIKFPVDSN
jgi:ABC-type uncharacterized transport system permease subunit